MKKAVIIFLAALMILILSFPGCGPREIPEAETPEVETPGAEIPEVETPEREELLEYEIVGDLNALPEKVQSAVEELKAERGYFVFSGPDIYNGDDVFLLVSSGEKATGGYGIALNTINAAIVGMIKGIIILNKILGCEAPSSSADSINSCGSVAIRFLNTII